MKKFCFTFLVGQLVFVGHFADCWYHSSSTHLILLKEEYIFLSVVNFILFSVELITNINKHFISTLAKISSNNKIINILFSFLQRASKSKTRSKQMFTQKNETKVRIFFANKKKCKLNNKNV